MFMAVDERKLSAMRKSLAASPLNVISINKLKREDYLDEQNELMAEGPETFENLCIVSHLSREARK